MPETIFISYARSDGVDHAAQLDNDLRQSGYNTWRDLRSIDYYQDFSVEIEQAIRAADYVAVVVTPSVELNPQSFVRREIIYAQSKEKPIIPLIFPQATPPTLINHLTWIPFFAGKKLTDHSLDYDSGLSALLARLKNRPLAEARQNEDPFTDYLRDLYDWLNDDLERRVFALMTLQADASPEAVATRQRRNIALNASLLDEPLFRPKTRKLDTPTLFDNVQQAFKHYDGRILLLGEPGAGKTVTMLAFARDAVAVRLADTSKPLPIFALIAAWDAYKQPALPQWLAEQTKLEAEKLKRLIDESKALIILDALDELGDSRSVDPQKPDGDTFDPRLRFTERLKTDAITTPLLISCRRKEYDEIGEKLPLNGALTLRPLNKGQIQDYLRELPQLWEAMQHDEQLRKIAQSPLILSFFTFAYTEAEPEELDQLRKIDNNLDLRDKVFEMFIKTAYQRECRKFNTDVPFTLENLIKSLSRLAIDNLAPERTENILTWGNIYDRFPSRIKASEFTAFTLKLYILTQAQAGAYRFVHLHLRNMLASKYALDRLFDSKSEIVNNAVYILKKLEDNRIMPLMIKVLNGSDKNKRYFVIDILAKLDDKNAFLPLIDLLDDPDEMIRGETIETLGKLKDPRTFSHLVEALQDPHYWVRRCAITALGKLKDPRTFSHLVEALQDPNGWLRTAAVEALGELKDPHAFPHLVDALQDPDPQVRNQVIKVFERWRDKQAVSALVNALQDQDLIVRHKASYALQHIGTAEAFQALKEWRQNQRRFDT